MRDFSKSQLFIVEDKTIVLADQPAVGLISDRLAIGSLVDSKYEILGLLGEGGMGVVYRVRHVLLDKVVALKTFKSVNLSAESFLRFQREANAIARINQENVIQVFDFGVTPTGFPYYTMENLQGLSLAEKLDADGPLSIEQAIELFVPVCQGLSAAHSKGIVHRDLKPSNILLVTNGASAKVKIVDFGIACLSSGAVAGQKLTAIGTIVGSPLYMSPEQSLGQNITEHADIYSLGCALFESVVGKPPFLGATAIETVMMHHHSSLPTMKEASGGKDFSPAFERVVARMLSKAYRDRQSSMAEVASELLALKSHSRSSSVLHELPSGSDVRPPGGRKGFQVYDPLVDSSELRIQSQSSIFSRLTRRFVVLAAVISLLVSVVVAFSFLKLVVPSSSLARPHAANLPALPRGLVVKEADGKDYLVFNFPEKEEYGKFLGAAVADQIVPAKGRVKFPANLQFVFQPNDLFLKDAANFDIFPSGQSVGLDFSNAPLVPENKSAVLQRIGAMTELWMLSFESSDIDDTDLRVLSRLNHLKRLSVSYTGISGAELSKYQIVNELDRLDFSGCRGTTDLLHALSGSKLTQLYVEHSPLSPEDFRLMGKLSNLHGLHVDGSGMRSSDLASLCSMKKLDLLSCCELQLSQKSCDVLRKMKQNSLVWLFVSGDGVSALDRVAIAKVLPEAQFRDYKRGVSQTVESAGFDEIYRQSDDK